MGIIHDSLKRDAYKIKDQALTENTQTGSAEEAIADAGIV